MKIITCVLCTMVAVDRQNMRFVPIKTDDRLDLQASKDERTVPNGVLATCSLKWSSMTVPFIRKSTQRNSSWPGETALHL
jgi:hypothetical protein